MRKKEISKDYSRILWQFYRYWSRSTSYEKLIDLMGENEYLCVFLQIREQRLSSWYLVLWIREVFTVKQVPDEDLLYNYNSMGVHFAWRYVLPRHSVQNRLSFHLQLWRMWTRQFSATGMAARSMNCNLWPSLFGTRVPRPPVGLFFDVQNPDRFGPFVDI